MYQQGGATYNHQPEQRDLLSVIKDYITNFAVLVMTSVQRVLSGTTGADRFDKIASSFDNMLSSRGVKGIDWFIDFIKNNAILSRSVLSLLRQKVGHESRMEDGLMTKEAHALKESQFRKEMASSFNQVSNYLMLFKEQLKCLAPAENEASNINPKSDCWQRVDGNQDWNLQNELAPDGMNGIIAGDQVAYDREPFVDPRLRPK